MAGEAARRPLLLGIDTGGTFTDAVLFCEQRGVIASAKALTTRQDLSVGVSAAVDRVLAPGDAARVRMVSLSTTLATNAIVEGQGSPVCLILIGQRPDALNRAGLGRALGGDPVVFVDGGHTALGDEERPLDMAAVRAGITAHAAHVSAFAIASHFAVRNAAHELAVAAVVRELSGLPVTCTHELTSQLDAPRRALTALLNARLVPFIQQLVVAVEGMLSARGMNAALMMVKGDGSLIAAETARARPVETILSGPAASVVGARYLADEDEALVVDMGGTTTDVVRLRGGWPTLTREGATVGGWRTMVEAVAAHTVGLGGDSEVRLESGRLRVGPRRVVPLSLLVHEHPETLRVLTTQEARGWAKSHDGCFVLRARPLETGRSSLTTGETRLWAALADGPVALDSLISSRQPLERPLRRLLARGLVLQSAFTPSDAAHILGLQREWSLEGARCGAVLWQRLAREEGWRGGSDAQSVARAVIDQVALQATQTLVDVALAEDHTESPSYPGPRSAAPALDAFGRLLVEHALTGVGSARERLLGVTLALRCPLTAIGAPVASYYPQVAQRLQARLCVPAHAGVANAVGAVVSAVIQRVRLLITGVGPTQFRAHLPAGVRDFPDLESAAASVISEAARIAEERARAAGAEDVRVSTERRDRIAEGAGGARTFIESEICAVARGRPQASVADR